MRWFLALSLCPVLAQGDDKAPLTTDRPGFSDSTGIVEKGTFQWEGGFFRTQIGSTSFTSYGDSTFRFGFGNNLEMKLIGLSYGAGGGIEGILDPTIGFKYRVYQGNGEVTLIGLTTFPIGESAVRANRWNPTGKIAWSKAVGSDSIGGNLVLSRLGAGTSAFNQWALSFYYSHPFTAKTALTGEVWGVDHVSKGVSSGTYGSLAITHLLNPDTQIDLRIGTGFNQSRDGWLLQGGIVIRF